MSDTGWNEYAEVLRQQLSDSRLVACPAVLLRAATVPLRAATRGEDPGPDAWTLRGGRLVEAHPLAEEAISFSAFGALWRSRCELLLGGFRPPKRLATSESVESTDPEILEGIESQFDLASEREMEALLETVIRYAPNLIRRRGEGSSLPNAIELPFELRLLSPSTQVALLLETAHRASERLATAWRDLIPLLRYVRAFRETILRPEYDHSGKLEFAGNGVSERARRIEALMLHTATWLQRSGRFPLGIKIARYEAPESSTYSEISTLSWNGERSN